MEDLKVREVYMRCLNPSPCDDGLCGKKKKEKERRPKTGGEKKGHLV